MDPSRNGTPEPADERRTQIHKELKMILQYALARRSQSAASGRWYKLQKDTYKTEWMGRGKSVAEITLLVKRLSKSRIGNIPVPPSRTEIAEERKRVAMRMWIIRMGFRPPNDSDLARGYYELQQRARQREMYRI